MGTLLWRSRSHVPNVPWHHSEHQGVRASWWRHHFRSLKPLLCRVTRCEIHDYTTSRLQRVPLLRTLSYNEQLLYWEKRLLIDVKLMLKMVKRVFRRNDKKKMGSAVSSQWRIHHFPWWEWGAILEAGGANLIFCLIFWKTVWNQEEEKNVLPHPPPLSDPPLRVLRMVDCFECIF